MEWVKKKSLKKTLFTLAFVNLIIAALLSVLSFLVCIELRTRMVPQGEAIVIDGSYSVTEYAISRSEDQTLSVLLSVLQLTLPVVFFIIALLATVFLFYNWKLKEPLKILMDGANHIIDNDLDFSIAARSTDELGQLCTAFETMRHTLLKNNRELWRQTEERKRLNAAFSHELRNPVTVLKGSAKMAMQCAVSGTEKAGLLLENLTRIDTYTHRIERYVEAMRNAERLEQIQLEKNFMEPQALVSELENMIRLVASDSEKQISFTGTEATGKIHVDKYVLFQTAENLVLNAIRFAELTILVNLSITDDMLIFEVADDGSGFPDKIIKNGIQPFQKGNEDTEHFGMGLYICDLLCKKHGGYLKIENASSGALVRAALKIS